MKIWVIFLVFFGFLAVNFEVLAEDLNRYPTISFTTINRYAQSTSDFDEVDDIRTFTSEALFSQSQLRLNRRLTKEELSKIIRKKNQFETFNNLRLRPTSFLAVDLSYKYRNIDDAQITNFFEPNQFNSVNLNEYGTALQVSSDINKKYGFLLRGAYKRIKREGVIEFFPNNTEDINQYEINALVSRDFGKESAALYGTYVYQDIQLNIHDPYDRKRNIFAVLFSYGDQIISKESEKEIRPLYSIENTFERRFDRRGLKFFAGMVSDTDTFGGVDVKRYDYFIGTSICAWMGSGNCPLSPFDISIGSDIFTSKVENDSTQDNAHYRTNVTIYYQVSRYISLLVPFRYDITIDGPDDFENYKGGIEIRYLKNSFEGQVGPLKKIHASIGYDHQKFFNLDKKLDRFSLNLSFCF